MPTVDDHGGVWVDRGAGQTVSASAGKAVRTSVRCLSTSTLLNVDRFVGQRR